MIIHDFEDFLTYARYVIEFLAIFGITVEVIPIKISPLRWIGNRINHDISQRLEKLEKEVKTIKTETQTQDIKTTRTTILNFSNSCRNGQRHSIEEFENVIRLIDDYTSFIEQTHAKNGVIDVQSKYIKKLYLKLLDNEECDDKFLNGGLLHYPNDEYKDDFNEED